MTKQYTVSDINDDTKLVRFLNVYGAEKSIGLMNYTDIECTFHYGFLHHYRTIETTAGDVKEGSTLIKLKNGIVGRDITTNNALISCWSIWNEKNDPWLAFKNSSFSKDKENIRVIVSTIGKVKQIFQQTIEINQVLFGNNFPCIVLHFTHNPVIYYPDGIGVEHKYWKEITDVITHGILAGTVNNIFHKRDSNNKGQRYDAEHEYRFAMILGNRNFIGTNPNIEINAQDIILRDYSLILKNRQHYIEKVYLRADHKDIKASCYFLDIELIEIKHNIIA